MEYNKDFETILSEMKNSIDGNISKGEGTLTMFALSPAAAEFEELYSNMEVADQNSSPLTCDKEHLLLFGQGDNIQIKKATPAIWLAKFNSDFEPGQRFECGAFTYISTEQIKTGEYYLQCEIPGTIGNVKPNEELLPISFISEGFKGRLDMLIKEGTDEEDLEIYRKRYLEEKKNGGIMSGNRAAYKKNIKEIPGVGGVKLERVTETRKRINAYIISSSYKKPDKELVDKVQEAIDPIKHQGEGMGLAPWFHVVDIHPVNKVEINISAKLTLSSGVTFESIEGKLKNAVDEYFFELNKTWENEETLVVRILRVAEKLGAVDGVLDVQNLSLNNSKDNLELSKYEIPARGGITNVT